MHVYVLVCVCSSQLGRVSVEYLVGSNESVHSQVVLHHFLCHVWWVGQHSALEQSGRASLARLARRAGGLDVTEECVPRLEDRDRWIQQRQTCPPQTWSTSVDTLCKMCFNVLLSFNHNKERRGERLGVTSLWKAGHESRIFAATAKLYSYPHTPVHNYYDICWTAFQRPTLATAVKYNLAVKLTLVLGVIHITPSANSHSWAKKMLMLNITNFQ